jgi:hypothetical protein
VRLREEAERLRRKVEGLEALKGSTEMEKLGDGEKVEVLKDGLVCG